MTKRIQYAVLAVILIVFALTAALAMRHTSTTFDEILFPAAGARGYETGDFTLVMDHPRLPQYLYGLPIYLSRFNYPSEEAFDWVYRHRYNYAQAFFWESGNDPEKIAFRARLVGVVIGLLLVLAVFLVARRYTSPEAALLAAALTAFMPDVLAHSGISYNDVAITLAMFVSVYVLDHAARAPTIRNVIFAALATGITVCTKFSGIVLGPVLVTLLAIEAASGRWRDRQWLRSLALGVPVFLGVLYLFIVAVYLGDFTLQEFRDGLDFNLKHARGGHGAAAVLLGRQSVTGWWYYFPVAFLLKTSAALHLLMAVAVYGAARVLRRPWRMLLQSPMRATVAGGALFLAVAMSSDLNIGFRHAMPMLPFVALLTAWGVAKTWSFANRRARIAIAVLVLWCVLSPYRMYPYFISYLSEYTGPLEDSYDTLADSSYDWGQGLLALRDFMREKNIDRVYLSYFGSAHPAGYGITYVPLLSFFPLPAPPASSGPPPKYVAISATNMTGNYFGADVFGSFRKVRPDTVLARSIWVFRLEDQ